MKRIVRYNGDMKTKTTLSIGNKYGRLTVVGLDHIGDHYRSYYLFRCDCGNEKIILGSGVVSGNTKSCGCLATEAKRANRLPENRGVINHLILQYKRHANDRHLPFRLSYKTFSKLLKQNCFYCGKEPANIKITKNCKEGFIYNGIDRVNPKRGYYADNVVSCCSMCNKAKGHSTVREYKEWILRVAAMADQWG
jgi:hypothetical protein